MYQCPVQKLMKPFYDEIDAAHQRISDQAIARVKPLLVELSRELPGRKLEYGDEIAPYGLPGVRVTPPVLQDGRTLALLADILEDAPQTIRKSARQKVTRIHEMLRDAGIKIGDTFGGIGDVVYDPDETIN